MLSFRMVARAHVVAALGVVALLAAAGVVVAQMEDGEVIHACADQNGILRLVDDSSHCRDDETPVSWNIKGEQGPPGPAGASGTERVFITDLPPDSEARAAYIKFDGIDGEATDSRHASWSDLATFSQAIKRGADAPLGVMGGGRSSSPPTFEDISVIKEIDKSTPKLAEAIATGKVFPTVQIHLVAAFPSGPQPYYTYELKNVTISDYQVGGSGQSDDVPVETLSLNFEEIKVTYQDYDSDGAKKGSVEYTWKVEEGEA